MYYVLVAVFFIVVYFTLVKVLSSVLKGCLVTFGLFLVVALVYLFIKSAKSPVDIFDFLTIDNFSVSFVEKKK